MEQKIEILINKQNENEPVKFTMDTVDDALNLVNIMEKTAELDTATVVIKYTKLNSTPTTTGTSIFGRRNKTI